LEALERSLDELLERRRRLELRLRRVRKELSKLQLAAREFTEPRNRFPTPEVGYGPTGPVLR